MRVRTILISLDEKLAARVFGPLVLFLANATRQSPYAISRLFWFVAALDAFAWADNIATIILFGGMSIYMMSAAALRADQPTKSRLKFRLIGLVLLTVLTLRGASTGQWAGTEFWLFVAIAQYGTLTVSNLADLPKTSSRN